MLTVQAKAGALGHVLSVWPLEGLEAKVSHIGGQPYLHDWSPIKPWTPGFQWVSLVGNIPWVVSHIIFRNIKCCPHDSTGRGQLKACAGVSWTLPHAPFPTDFNLYSFSEISCNHEYNSFSEFCESFWQIIEPDWGTPNSGLENPWTQVTILLTRCNMMDIGLAIQRTIPHHHIIYDLTGGECYCSQVTKTNTWK